LHSYHPSPQWRFHIQHWSCPLANCRPCKQTKSWKRLLTIESKTNRPIDYMLPYRVHCYVNKHKSIELCSEKWPCIHSTKRSSSRQREEQLEKWNMVITHKTN
jgi:hypothetical protein